MVHAAQQWHFRVGLYSSSKVFGWVYIGVLGHNLIFSAFYPESQFLNEKSSQGTKTSLCYYWKIHALPHFRLPFTWTY